MMRAFVTTNKQITGTLSQLRNGPNCLHMSAEDEWEFVEGRKKKKMTTRRWPGLPAVRRCLPSDKSEASGEARERGGTRRWRGRQSHSLCVIWENLQINTNNSLVLWAPLTPHHPTPSHPHHHSPPLPSLPSLSLRHSLTFSPSPVLLLMALFKLLSGEEDALLPGVIRAGRMGGRWES